MREYLIISRTGWKFVTRGHAPLKRGRPRTITNMRAYKAQKQREYRAKLKPTQEPK